MCLQDCISATEKYLHEGEYRKEEIVDLSLLGRELLDEIFDLLPVMKDVWEDNETFQLKRYTSLSSLLLSFFLSRVLRVYFFLSVFLLYVSPGDKRGRRGKKSRERRRGRTRDT